MAKKPSDFNKLKAKWYKKLEKSGFEDIERDENNLKSYSNRFLDKKSELSWQAKASYYEMCDQLLLEHKFESALEKTIWEYHTNAISIRDIAHTLTKAKVPKMTKDTVWPIIRRLEHIMKIRYLIGYADKNEQ